MNYNKEKTEDDIKNFFNKRSPTFDKNDSKPLKGSDKLHVEFISKHGSKTACDVGFGAGGIVNGLLEEGLDFVYGFELTEDMVPLAKERLKKNNFLDKSQLMVGSYLDADPNLEFDALSMHFVLCCHPDRDGFLKKSVSYNPNLIVISIPRDRLLFKPILSAFVLIRKIKKGFRPYLHSVKEIDAYMAKHQYKLKEVKNRFASTTRTYVKE